MPTNLSVRPITQQDYDQWLPLWNGYNKFYGRSGETALAPEITQMTWSRFFDVYEPVYALVAESDGKLLGLTHYLFTGALPPLPSIVICRTCLLPKMPVEKGWQGL
jgi:hypothetical protein